jgi:hypothetical protein
MAANDLPPDPDELQALRELVRRHHVYLEVEPVFEAPGGRQVKVGMDLKLWGAHLRSTSVHPGCPRCQAIHTDLQLIASSLLAPEERGPRAELLPFDRGLYLSDRFGRDEINLTLRLRAPRGEAAGASEDRLLMELRLRLESLGVFTGGWRPSDL